MSLAGLRLWVTRPRQQADALIALLKDAGAEVAALPLLEIAPTENPAPLDAALAGLESFDLAIFVSPSALDAVCERLLSPWPEKLAVAVMGPGSLRRAHELGIKTIISPQGQFDSAGLLQLPQMQNLAGRRVVLFRGNGGRDALPRTLTGRGAELTLVECYRRLPPAFDASRLEAEFGRGCDGIVVSSSEAVHYLFRLAGGQTLQRLQSSLYFAPHPRILAALEAEGAQRAVLTAVGDAGIAASLNEYFSPAAGRALTAKKTNDAG